MSDFGDKGYILDPEACFTIRVPEEQTVTFTMHIKPPSLARRILHAIGRFILWCIAMRIQAALHNYAQEQEHREHIRKKYRKVFRTNWLGITTTEFHER